MQTGQTIEAAILRDLTKDMLVPVATTEQELKPLIITTPVHLPMFCSHKVGLTIIAPQDVRMSAVMAQGALEHGIKQPDSLALM